MKNILYIIIGVALLMACSGQHEQRAKLDRIDSLMNDHPDSALTMLDSLKAEKANWSKSLRMRFNLLEAKAQNKADVPFTSDSVAKEFTHYYDNHGTANERMLAHYLLGCVYRDLGDSPQAVDCYLDAIAKADTIAKDCDYNTLFRVYAQMASIYHKQLLLSNEIEAYKMANYYAFLAKDTLNAIFALDKSTSAYILLNKKDSAEIISRNVNAKYLKNGYLQNALQSSLTLIFLYVKNKEKLTDAKRLMDEYEAKSILFKNNYELLGSKRQYYNYKGQYYEGINNLDSAEYYYRKTYHPNMPYVAQDPMYRGLLSVFTKRHQADSVAKYSLLYCEANDSSIAKKDQELTAQMAASYNYGLYQKEALKNESKAHKTQITLFIVLIIVVIISILIYVKWKENKKKHKELQAEFADATNEYNNNLHTLQLLDKAHQGVIKAIQEELNAANKNNQTILSELASTKSINTHFEKEKQQLLENNEELKQKITELQSQKVIQQQIENHQKFIKTDTAELVLNIAAQPCPKKLSEKIWNELASSMSRFYPSLLYDLSHKANLTQREMRICLLTCLGLRESDICNLLDISSQQVTNSKANINKKIFNDKAARTLYKNLAEHYGIYIM